MIRTEKSVSKKSFETLAAEKIGDWKKLEILVQNQSFWNIVGARPTAAPRNSGRDNAAGITIVWRTSPPLILHINSVKQVATATPSHVYSSVGQKFELLELANFCK